MTNVKLLIEYNGSNFHGWQIQPHLRTVQGELTKAIALVARQPVRVIIGAGRTDAGVHARGQVANVHLHEPFDCNKICRAVSSLLKNEVSILSAEIVDDRFHAQHDAKKKQYTYTIYHAHVPPVLHYGRVWHVSRNLDLARMQQAASVLIGTHDFSSFRGSGCSAHSPIRRIEESEVQGSGDCIIYRVVGEGFLKQMVRNIVGTLVELGSDDGGGRTMRDILLARDRRAAGVTAQPQGLCLDWVLYDQ